MKMKTLQDKNQQSRVTTLVATENEHDPKFISALEEWYLRKVCYFLVSVVFCACVNVFACVHVFLYSV
jgi:hypothetical protein